MLLFFIAIVVVDDDNDDNDNDVVVGAAAFVVSASLRPILSRWCWFVTGSDPVDWQGVSVRLYLFMFSLSR